MAIFWVVVIFYTLTWLMWGACFTLAWDMVAQRG